MFEMFCLDIILLIKMNDLFFKQPLMNWIIKLDPVDHIIKIHFENEDPVALNCLTVPAACFFRPI